MWPGTQAGFMPSVPGKEAESVPEAGLSPALGDG